MVVYFGENQMKIFEPVKYAGCYEIGGNYGLRIFLKEKSFWLHRKMAEWFFGFVWLDEELK